jgi:hypothetical protein
MPESFDMTKPFTHSVLALCLSLGALGAAHADSTLSTASSAGSTSVGSLSNSVTLSSNSSSGDKKVADGDYRVQQVAALAEREGVLRVHLTHQLEGGPLGPTQTAATTLTLDMPREALGTRPLVAGDVVTVRNRAYGLAFARPTATAQPDVFFVALDDTWRHELNPRAVKL